MIVVGHRSRIEVHWRHGFCNVILEEFLREPTFPRTTVIVRCHLTSTEVAN